MKPGTFPITHITFFFLLLISSCAPVKRFITSQEINHAIKRSERFDHHFSGLVLYDPEKRKYLKNINGNLNFTPASNTKILTAYAAMSALGDSIPAFLYSSNEDTISIEPLGDPTFLHPDFATQKAYQVLRNYASVLIKLPEVSFNAFGAGWAWDDYHHSYQVERSLFPIYGNEVRIHTRDSIESVTPVFFRPYVSFEIEPNSTGVSRDFQYNIFKIGINDTSLNVLKIPFRQSNELLIQLLEDTLHNKVSISKFNAPLTKDTLYSQDKWHVLTLMMQRSDNFLAEQLLLLAARKDRFTNIDAYRWHLLRKWGLNDRVQWVDGSGLSRYNLMKPTALVSILENMYLEYSWDQLQTMLPAGGISGTLKNWYPGETPYIYAKTGTLSNNHSLSGFLIAKSGKILIFSFMNNNYLGSSASVKKKMQIILEAIRDAY